MGFTRIYFIVFNVITVQHYQLNLTFSRQVKIFNVNCNLCLFSDLKKNSFIEIYNIYKDLHDLFYFRKIIIVINISQIYSAGLLIWFSRPVRIL